MRVVALAAILLAGCTAGPGATPTAATAAPSGSPATSATMSIAPATPSPTAAPSSTAPPSPSTEFTPDDEAIARLVRTGAAEAIPQLKSLNSSDPSKLEDLFLPLGVWIEGQRTSMAAYVASTCTSEAVAQFLEGLQRYDAIRKRFLAWRDWGALGNAFPPGAPREAADSFRHAIAELEARCPA
jgi:hypothetical protein